MSADHRAEVERRLKTLLDERLEGLSRRVREWLEESHARAGSLAEIIEEARRDPLLAEPAAATSATGSTEAPDAARELSELATFAHEVECSADQTAILGRLLDGAASLASRVMLMAVRNETLVGWSARGFARDFTPRQVTSPAAGDTVLARALSACAPAIESPSQSPGNELLARTLGGEAPAEMMAAPLWVRDRVAALLYADAADASDAWYPDAIRLMVSLAALSLEAIPARAKHPRPAAPPASSPRTPVARPAGPPPAPRTPAARPSAAPSTEVTGPREEIDPEEARLHEDARRFARLLVSEILLYNEKEIEEGRRNKDLYERLKEDIDRSRQMYLQRISTRLPGGPDYFHQELVRTLANGDESALNVTWD